MAIYNLFDGGEVRLNGGCCGCNNDVDLPKFSQPDLRNDASYGFRKILHWQYVLHKLGHYYGKSVKDLKVGDKLRLFLQPNHATLKSLFVDFRKPVAGFEFKFSTVRELDLTATCYQSQYEVSTLEVTSEEKTNTAPTSAMGANVEAGTQMAFLFTDSPHSAKVDALELEITALPVNGLTSNDQMEIIFVRRFEMDGIQY